MPSSSKFSYTNGLPLDLVDIFPMALWPRCWWLWFLSQNLVVFLTSICNISCSYIYLFRFCAEDWIQASADVVWRSAILKPMKQFSTNSFISEMPASQSFELVASVSSQAHYSFSMLVCPSTHKWIQPPYLGFFFLETSFLNFFFKSIFFNFTYHSQLHSPLLLARGQDLPWGSQQSLEHHFEAGPRPLPCI